MEWLRYFLVDFLQVWKWQGLQNGIIAIARAAQFWLAYRHWRPKVEIYTDLTVEQGPVKQPRPAHLYISNLSPTGIWVDHVLVIARESDYAGEPFYGPVKQLVRPYGELSVRCDTFLLRAFKQTGITEEPHVGRIKLSVRYRAHGLWFYTSSQWYDAHVWDAGVTELTPL